MRHESVQRIVKLQEVESLCSSRILGIYTSGGKRTDFEQSKIKEWLWGGWCDQRKSKRIHCGPDYSTRRCESRISAWQCCNGFSMNAQSHHGDEASLGHQSHKRIESHGLAASLHGVTCENQKTGLRANGHEDAVPDSTEGLVTEVHCIYVSSRIGELKSTSNVSRFYPLSLIIGQN